MADAVEALRIGRVLGDRVLLVSCSTGSTLATWLGSSPWGRELDAHVFLSPNFGPKDWRAELLNWPWGRQLALALEGESRSWAPQSEAEAQAMPALLAALHARPASPESRAMLRRMVALSRGSQATPSP
jgi:hypothetical protein